MERRLIFLFGVAAWWLLFPLERYLAVDGWRLMSAGIPLLIVFLGILAASFKFRRDPLVVVLWTPLSALSAWILYETTFGIIGEMRVPAVEAAPLEGVAMVLGFAVWCAALIIFIGCIVSFPRKINYTLLGVSVANCVILGFTIWATTEAEARQIITVRVLDRAGHPVVGAQIKWQVFGYGPGGSRPSSPEISGGPVLTDAQGIADIRSKRMRHEVLVDVAKQGYLSVSAELGMQFDQYWPSRDLRIHVGKILNVAHGDVPSPDPVSFTLYLPPLSDAPQPLRFKQIGFDLSRSSPYRYFSFTSGFLRKDPVEGDLQFDFVDDTNSRWPKLEMTALHGGGILQVPFKFEMGKGVMSYEQMMLMAPSSGYQESIVPENFSQPGPQFYFRKADGSLYARLSVDASPNKDSEGSVLLTVWVNLTGSRLLMFDPKLEIGGQLWNIPSQPGQ